jgi:hypothetical protein
MPLNLGGDNDFTPYLKYNAKAGRFYVRPQGVTEDVEVVNPRLAIDMANIRTGWIYYPQAGEGGGPEKVWDASLAQAAPKPPGPKKYRRGFEVMVYGNDNLPGVGVLGLREWSSNAGNANNAIVKMYEAYEAGAAQNPGKVPFYVCAGVTPITGQYGTNYEPKFELKGWVERTKIPAFDDYHEKQSMRSEPAHAHAGPMDSVPPVTADPLSDSIPF